MQLSFSRSIDPILPLDLSITRMAATEAKEADSPNQTMGRKNLIPYGLSLRFYFLDETAIRKIEHHGCAEPVDLTEPLLL